MACRRCSCRSAPWTSSLPALEPLTAGGYRQRRRELPHHAERVLELHAIRGLRNDDPVERPDGVEVEFLCQAGEIFKLLDGHPVTEVRQVESELHEMASSRCVRGLARPTLRSTSTPPPVPGPAAQVGRRTTGPRTAV